MPGCISLNGDPGCRKDLKGCGDVGSRRIEKSGMNRPKECPAYIRVVSPDISLKYIELVRLTVEFVNILKQYRATFICTKSKLT